MDLISVTYEACYNEYYGALSKDAKAPEQFSSLLSAATIKAFSVLTGHNGLLYATGTARRHFGISHARHTQYLLFAATM